ncbi:NAD(P)H-quinone oxidoreductase subunit I, chloroplastic [anaerobic digester metagenome]
MTAIIDPELCTGCETCVGACPAGAIRMEDVKPKIDAGLCIDCGTCVDECPSGAVRLE